jgi:hypothetical protein
MMQSPAVSQTPSARIRIMGVVSGTAGGLASFVVFGTLVFVVPRFEAIFADFKCSLPVLTQAVITVSHLMSYAWPLASVLMFGVPVAAVLVSVLARLRGGVALVAWLGLGSAMLMILVLAGILVALLLPMMSLVQAISAAQ